MSSDSTTYSCEYAVVGGVVESDVTIAVVDGVFASVEVGADQAGRSAGSAGAASVGVVRLKGLTIPGLANAHSHAFHRALRSRVQAHRQGWEAIDQANRQGREAIDQAHRQGREAIDPAGQGSFWTWRDLMYRAAARLNPDNYHQLARATFAEMAMAGVTAVGEFHYVHHRADGKPYAEPNAMGEAVFSAATEAGIRITLLDTLYLHGGLSSAGEGGESPLGLQPHQLRFGDQTVDGWIDRVEGLAPGDGQLVGASIHSVRAVDPASVRKIAEWASAHRAPLHCHVSEQRAENEQCLSAYGVTPMQLLADAGAMGDRFTAVHATHLTSADVGLLATSGSTVCMCPTTERDLGDGIGPTSEFAASGIPMAVGSDSNAVIDMFEESRALELNERLRSETRGIHSAGALLEMATVNGHRSLGWTAPETVAAGSITPAARADLVTINLGSVRTAGACADS
ncbi:MAG: formimidoylglutamate deiminase, partial [Actinobacteria bacterium]|nr:formimidoylglutamate deiminase [Actinomycetota bacterium]